MKPLIDGVKICRVCKIEKPYKDYHLHKHCVGGVTGTCRLCVQEYKRAWYAENRKRRQDKANNVNRSRKRMIVDHFGDKCHDCGNTYHQCVYEFHHLDPTQKDVNPSRALSWKEEKMWTEINKCIMLCSNCHKIRHFASEVC